MSKDLVGDRSPGKNLLECEQDMQYICDLPGQKILTRSAIEAPYGVWVNGILPGIIYTDMGG